MQDNLG